MSVGKITQLTNHPSQLPEPSEVFPCCTPSDLDVAQQNEKLWRDECTRIVNALADLAGLPRDPCPGWESCITKIKAMLSEVSNSKGK